MGVLAKLGKKETSATPTAGHDPAEVAARKAQLLAEEAALKAPAKAAPEVNVTLTGADARKYAEAAGMGDIPPGAGLQVPAAAARAAGISVIPPDAPASGVTGPVAKPIPPAELATMSPAIQAAAAEVGAVEGQAPAEAPRAKRGRKPKADTPATTTTATATLVDGLALYVNVEIDGIDAEPLEDYVGEICRMMAEDAKLPDIRMGTGDNPLAFGRWRGALAHVLRSHPPKGAYYVSDVGEKEIMSAALEALWPLATVRVRGRR